MEKRGKGVGCQALPPGWKKEEVIRKSGLSAGNSDVYYFGSLVSGNSSNVSPVSPPLISYRNGSPVRTSSAPPAFRGRKRLKEQDVHYEVKRQRFHSPHYESTSPNHTVPLPEDHRHLFPGSISSPLYQEHYISGWTRCVSPLQKASFPDPIEAALPVAKDELSQQVLELFQVCQQQSLDLNRKEFCRTILERKIQQLFPNSRLFLVGSTLNGFGTRTSDGDLCLVLQQKRINQNIVARSILRLLRKYFSQNLTNLIERPQLIAAKVPIVKFRDKVSCVEFDLNVNNVGIRNTFLLRTYANIENRVHPLVLVVKKWARFNGINNAPKGTLSSYSLVLMVLHYLQTLPEPILPSLQKNYPASFDPNMQLHDVLRAPCTIPSYISKNNSTLGDLFLGFLKYYATEFDWDGQMISVREAKAIPRPDSDEWRNKFICVEEPFDRTNTARAVHQKRKFDTILKEFQRSWKKLKDRMDLNCILPFKAMLQSSKMDPLET